MAPGAEPAIEMKKETMMGRGGLEAVRGRSRPDYYSDIQPRSTYSGHPVREVPWSLPYWTKSLCPECRSVISARKFIENNIVYLEKECDEHGYFRELISPDAEFYMNVFTYRFGDGRGIMNPMTQADPDKSCPENCGLCDQHHSHTCMANVDLTNRCDMRCPVCFANANAMGYITEPSIEQVKEMLKVLRDRKPVPTKVVQFSGGEPTCHPNFIEIVKMAKDMGFGHIQIATNGKNISDHEFARKCVEAGLKTLYLQFDGVTDEIYRKTRGEKGIYETKLKCVEVCRNVGLKIVLVPTVIRGINDNQVGAIVRFACDNADVISGISFQPVCFTGRISEKDRERQRYTITHLAKDIYEQTNGMMPLDSWMALNSMGPLSQLSQALSGKPAFFVSCHPDCGAGGYLFIEPEEKKEVKAMTEFLDVKAALKEINELAMKIERKKKKWWYRVLSKLGLARSHNLFIGGAGALRVVRRHFQPKLAPKGLTFKRLLGVMDGYKDTDRGRRPDAEKTTGYCTIFVAGMHFQDVYNYDVERVKRCVIHHVAPDGKMYPFCSYNSGPYHRERVEEATQTVKLTDYPESGDIHASTKKDKRFDLPKGLFIKVKDYGVSTVSDGVIHDNYGCCSTAKG